MDVVNFSAALNDGAESRPVAALESGALLESRPCAVCESTKHERLFAKKETRSWWLRKCDDDPRLDRAFEFSLVRCSVCRHVFVEPRLKQSIIDDVYARYWRSHQPARVGRSEYGNYVSRQLAALRPLGDLLDFGCGWGTQLREAGEVGWRAVGLEVDKRKVEFCREHGLRAELGDLLDRPFPSATFDAVIAEQVLEHLYSPREYLLEIHRVLRPGGVVYVAVPNWGGIRRRIEGKRWDMIHPVSHVRYFDAVTLSALLRRCGFEVLRPAYVRRFRGRPLANAVYAAKTFGERNLGIYPIGLALYARK